MLTRGQAQFASDLAGYTGLDPKVIGSWLLAEENGSAAANYERSHYHNWLNIARTDTGDASGAHSPVWNNPASAAKATAEWLKGTGRIAHEYGKPAAGVRAILSTAHRGAGAQIAAIANSGWASSHYNGGSTLRSLYSSIGGQKLPAPSQAPASGPLGAAQPQGGISARTTTSAAPGGSNAALSGLLEALSKPKASPVGYAPAPGTSARAILPGGRSAQPIPVGAAQQQEPDLKSLVEAALTRPANSSGPETHLTGGPTPSEGPTPSANAPATPTGKGPVNFGGKQVAGWIAPILAYAQAHGWKGAINSGYRSLAEQTRIYNSGVRPAARPGTSNHEFTAFPGGAVDVSEAPTLSHILENSPYRGKLVWAGAKDPVHFSHPHGGSY